MRLIDDTISGSPANELRGKLTQAVSRMILSASGWRAIFAADGDEESTSPLVYPYLIITTAIAAGCYATTMKPHGGTVAVGTDSRPTGQSIARAAVRALLACGMAVEYLGVCASPEIMAYAAGSAGVQGFFYISASHNPVGHNGLKMGGSDGGVLGGDSSRSLIEEFRRRVAEDDLAEVARMLAAVQTTEEADCFEAESRIKARAAARYTEFCHEVIRGPGPRAQAAYAEFRRAVADARPGILGDLNGSARAASIDRDFLADTGCRVQFINDRPGAIAHQIVPEGAGLEPCRRELERLYRRDSAYEIGYVPDNDGDRGNLVSYDPRIGAARQLVAQEVFALSCVCELCWLVHTGELELIDGRPSRRVALVVNGPTSMRIDRIAARFGAEVHRAEVGEANVVARARQLRQEGALVRVLGEGSNGGTIIHPSAVRDPLHTIHSILKFLYAPAGPSGRSPAGIWFALCGLPVHSPATLGLLLSSLPVFTTTSAFEERAVMRILGEAGPLKDRLEARLDTEMPDLLRFFPPAMGLVDWRIINYEGTTARVGAGNRFAEGRGGLKIELVDGNGLARAFLWMRGSGTEPVFRVMADVEGDCPELEARLLDRLRSLVAVCDEQAVNEA